MWYFSTRGSRRDRDKEFDFAGEDAWDPAVISGSALGSKRLSRRGGGGESQNRYNNLGGEGGIALPEREPSARKRTAANEQFDYYANTAPPPPPAVADAGLAGVGAAGAARRPSRNTGASEPYRAMSAGEDAYGGIDDGIQGGGENEGGWGVANQMRQQHPTDQQQFERRGSASNRSPRIPPPVMPVSYGGPVQQQPQYLPPHLQPGGAAPPSIPYIPPSSAGYAQPPYSAAPLLAPSPNRFESTGIASPAPSHRSIPGLGGWSNEDDDGDAYRGGPLRITNEEPEVVDDAEEDRWRDAGGSGGAYDRNTLTAGLGGRSEAPTYATRE